MGGNLFEVTKRGFHGGPINYYLVTSGAHDGNKAPAFLGGDTEVKPVRSRADFQFKSWYDPGLLPGEEGYHVIGQIFFGTDDRALDEMTDRIVLDYLIRNLKSDLAAAKRIDLAFVG
jgi:hypothetical protein